MIRASIDLGTNTCLLLIVEWDPKTESILRVISDNSTVVRLGEGVDQNRELQARPMERTLECLKNYALKVQDAGLATNQVICVSTSQARDAKNSDLFFSKIQKLTGFSFRILSGVDEARFTFLGALLPGMSPQHSCVIDVGGGSTELISLQDCQSIDIGSVRFTERYLKSDPVTDAEFWACQEAIDQAFQAMLPWREQIKSSCDLIAVAGSATTLAAWHAGLKQFDSSQVDSVVLSRGDLHRMVEELKWRTIEERRDLPCMEFKRADVILAGAMILWRALEVLNFQSCQISTRGLRFGILKASKRNNLPGDPIS